MQNKHYFLTPSPTPSYNGVRPLFDILLLVRPKGGSLEGTRLRILTLLQRRDCSIATVSEAMGMATATIRRHLDILQRDGLVAYRAMRRKQGRPEHEFHLTDAGHEAMPKRYDILLQRLLRLITTPEGDPPAADTEALFARMGERLAAEYGNGSQDGSQDDSEARDGEALLRALDLEQFAPTIEREGTRVRVHLWNCPFRSVALENPAVCTMDRTLISRLLGTPVSDTERIGRGDQRCTYTTI